MPDLDTAIQINPSQLLPVEYEGSQSPKGCELKPRGSRPRSRTRFRAYENMASGSTFARLWASWHWRPIHNCRGRYCLVAPNARLPVSALISDRPATIYRLPTARDPVLVVEFEGSGLISYLRADGTLMHTLNTSEGFRRKLRQLGIAPEAGTIGS
jgi:hypothetical protein